MQSSEENIEATKNEKSWRLRSNSSSILKAHASVGYDAANKTKDDNDSRAVLTFHKTFYSMP